MSDTYSADGSQPGGQPGGSFFEQLGGGLNFDSMIDSLAKMLSAGATMSSLTPHDTGPMGAAKGGANDDMGISSVAGRGLLSGDPTQNTGDNPLDPGSSIDASKNMPGNPMAPPAGMPELPSTVGPNNPMQAPAPQPLPGAPGGIGSDYARSQVEPFVGPLAGGPSGVAPFPTPEQAFTPQGPLPSQGGPAPLPLTPPAPREAPGALPPTAAPTANGPLGGLLQQLIGGGAPQDRAAQFGWPKRGGNYNNQDSRMAASLGAGLSGLNANPGSKFGAFAGGFGKSMAGGSAQDTANRKQDESEHKQEFAEDEKLTKLPFELGTAKAKMDLVNAQAKVWGAKVDQNGKLTLGTNEKMWQSPIGRQTMIDRPINTMMENEFKNVRRKYGADMSTSDAAKYEKDLETVRQKFEARRQELYKQYNITPEVAAKNKLAGTNAANAFDPHAIGGGKMTDEQFKQLVPPGAWFIPKPGATPVQRAQETVMDRLGDAHDQNEKAAQKDKDINDLERQQYYSDNNQAGTQ